MYQVPTFETYIAGENVAGDRDQNGDPIIHGKLYVACRKGIRDAKIIAGPFDSSLSAEQVAYWFTAIREQIDRAKESLEDGKIAGVRAALAVALALTRSPAKDIVRGYGAHGNRRYLFLAGAI